MGVCNLCGRSVPDPDLMRHLADEHDLELEIQTWPDGSPVIVDTTLEPEDFGA